MTKKIFTTFASISFAALVATSFAFAQNSGPEGRPEGMPPPPEERGFFGKIMNQFKGERKEAREEFRGERKEAMEEFKEGRKERREWMAASTTPGMATPTPWKNFREDMKDARGEFKDNMKGIRDDMRGKMATLTDAQITALATKLGTTTDAVKAKIAKDMEMRVKMMASSTASGTMPTMHREDRLRPAPIQAVQNFFKRFFNW